jgi:hypothetical protein
MPVTYQLISSNVLGSAAASVTFSSIPATYTDLVVRGSVRNDNASNADGLWIRLNGLTTSIYSDTTLYGNGSSALSFRASNATKTEGAVQGTTTTSNTFTTFEFYLPSYLSSSNKPASGIFQTENNATEARTYAIAHLIRTTNAITQIEFSLATGNFVSGSSFYLYGISKS